MTSSILVTYTTRYGSTQEVADFIAKTLREAGLSVDVQPMQSIESLQSYEAVICGAPLYIGKILKDAHRFFTENQEVLSNRPVAIFGLGPIGTDEKEMQGSRKQYDKELAQYPWLKPIAYEVFVGKYDPAKLNFFFKLLAKLPASPLHGLPASDNRNWEAIRTWAETLPPKLQK